MEEGGVRRRGGPVGVWGRASSKAAFNTGCPDVLGRIRYVRVNFLRWCAGPSRWLACASWWRPGRILRRSMESARRTSVGPWPCAG